MKKKFKLLILSIMTFIVMMSLQTKANMKAVGEIVQHASSGILMEVETGKILHEYNAHEKRPPASMTKVMTMKLVMDAIASKRITNDQLITTSAHAASMGGSQIYLSVGEQMKVEDLFKSMAIASANDAAVALAEAISGSEEFFVTAMNNEAKKLGLKESHFVNATGLPVNNHYTSCYDMAMIARELLLHHEKDVVAVTSRYEDYVRQETDKPFWLVNTNKLIRQVEGMDGLKTGWTEEAGYCLTSTMKKDGMRVISVIMNAKTKEGRNQDTTALLNYAYANYEKQVISPKGAVVKIEEDVLLDPSVYHVVTSQDIVRIIDKNISGGTVRYEVILDKNAIKRYQKENIGVIKTYVDDKLVSTIPLNIQEIVHRANFFEILLEIIKKIL